MSSYWAEYVPSKLNLADGPSRGNFQLMTRLAAVQVPFRFPSYSRGLDGWMAFPQEVDLLLL